MFIEKIQAAEKGFTVETEARQKTCSLQKKTCFHVYWQVVGKIMLRTPKVVALNKPKFWTVLPTQNSPK